MALVGRCSELKAFVFTFSSNQNGQVLLFILNPSSCERIKDLIKSMTHGTFQQSCVASQIPVRALKYYRRSMTKHPELRKGRRPLFIPIKDNNTGKELSAATISRWICTTKEWILMPPFRTARVSQEMSELLRSVEWLLFTAFQQSRPTSSDEGQEIVQWRHLHVLLS